MSTGRVDVPYSSGIKATGGTAPYRFALFGGTLPPGLSIDPQGRITGTPTATGSFTYQVTVTDSGNPPQTITVTCTITISQTGVTVGTVPTGTVGVGYSSTITLAGGREPYSFALTSGNLPDGLTINKRGRIAGTPRKNGTFAFKVAATDSSTPTQEFAIDCALTIGAGFNVIAVMGPGNQDVPFTSVIQATGGRAPYRFDLASGALPAELALNAENGTIVGTAKRGESSFEVKVSDASGVTVTFPCLLSIKDPTR